MPSTPYMKLYVGDYLGDTQHLSCLEHGAYMLLIMAYWQAGGPISSDPVVLRRITKTSLKEYKNWYENVIKMFEVRDSMLVHKRIDSEIAKRKQVSVEATNAANTRWCERNADALPTQYGRNATPIVHSPEFIDKSNTNTSSKPQSETPETFEAFWTAYPRKLGKQDALKKYKAILKAGITHETVMERLAVYQSQIKANGTEAQYIRHPSRFLNTLDDFEKPVETTKPVAADTPDPVCIVVPDDVRAMLRRSYANRETSNTNV